LQKATAKVNKNSNSFLKVNKDFSIAEKQPLLSDKKQVRGYIKVNPVFRNATP